VNKNHLQYVNRFIPYGSTLPEAARHSYTKSVLKCEIMSSATSSSGCI